VVNSLPVGVYIYTVWGCAYLAAYGDNLGIEQWLHVNLVNVEISPHHTRFRVYGRAHFQLFKHKPSVGILSQYCSEVSV
jgi:hypothetical protein